MIVKSIPWKTPAFHHVLEYVTNALKMDGTPVTLNFPVVDPTNLDAVRQTFMANARYLPSRKNGVAFYHEILSFSPQDSPSSRP